MASVIDFVEENLFDHLIKIKLDSSRSNENQSRFIAVDRFTNQIYAILVNIMICTIRVERWDVLIYSKSGEFLRSFSHKRDMETIHGMAIHKNNVYIVSGKSCFLHFKVADSMNLIGSKNDRGFGIGKFMGAKQLDISNEGDLYVADFGNNRVQILDCNLQYKRHISHHSMLKPRDVKLTPDEVYVLGESPKQSNYCCHIFTHMGEKLRSIILYGIPNGMRRRGFCVDNRGNVIIVDNATSQIKFFTKEGNLICTMDTLGWTNRTGVAWITDQKLVVLCGCHSGILEIYSYF